MYNKKMRLKEIGDASIKPYSFFLQDSNIRFDHGMLRGSSTWKFKSEENRYEVIVSYSGGKNIFPGSNIATPKFMTYENHLDTTQEGEPLKIMATITSILRKELLQDFEGKPVISYLDYIVWPASDEKFGVQNTLSAVQRNKLYKVFLQKQIPQYIENWVDKDGWFGFKVSKNISEIKIIKPTSPEAEMKRLFDKHIGLGVWEKFNKNLKEMSNINIMDMRHVIQSIPPYFIDSAFEWSETPEGHDYWDDIEQTWLQAYETHENQIISIFDRIFSKNIQEIKIGNPTPIELRYKMLFDKYFGKGVWEKFKKNTIESHERSPHAGYEDVLGLKFFEIYIKDITEEKRYTPEDLILDGFAWVNSPEGHNYWSDINKKWRSILSDKNELKKLQEIKVANPVSLETKLKVFFDKHFGKGVWNAWRKNTINFTDEYHYSEYLKNSFTTDHSHKELIENAFDWVDSSEGYDYWDDINDIWYEVYSDFNRKLQEIKVNNPISYEMKLKVLFDKHLGKGVWEKFKNNIKTLNNHLDFNEVIGTAGIPHRLLISVAFGWAASPEGFDYWENIDGKWRDIDLRLFEIKIDNR